MKKRRFLYIKGICIILLLAVVICVLTLAVFPKLVRRTDGEPEAGFSSGISDAQTISCANAYQAVALAMTDQESCARASASDSAAEGEGGEWYRPYADYLYQQGILTQDDVQRADTPLTAEQLGRIMECFGLRAELCVGNDFGLNLQYGDLFLEGIADMPVSAAAWWACYDALLNTPEVSVSAGGAVNERTVVVCGTPDSVDTLAEWECSTDSGSFYFMGMDSSAYLDRQLRVLQRDGMVLRVLETEDVEVRYDNVYIVQAEVAGDAISGDSGTLKFFVNGILRTIEVSTSEGIALQESYSDGIADFVFRDGTLQSVTVKTDYIRAKVLAVTDSYVELEGYGKIPFDEAHKIYKTYGVLEELPSDDAIVVGYDLARFIVADGQICAAVLTQTLEAQNIRVLLKTTDFTDIFHESVTLTGIDAFYVSYGDTVEEYAAGEPVTFTADSECFQDGARVFVQTVQENKGIRIDSITREQGTPEYKGTLEMTLEDGGIVIVNDILLEDYLEKVVPSEMPPSYGEEAAKVQAICARTFACEQIAANSYRQYGAHLDDSAQFQVYNNVDSYEVSTAAIRETYGQILEYDGEIAGTYYFSTSCGATTDLGVWSDTPDTIPYLQSKLIAGDGSGTLDLTQEEVFAEFIMDTEFGAYEQSYDWFRWNTTVSLDVLTEVVNGKLASGAVSSPDVVLVKETGSEQDFIGKPAELTNIGNVLSVSVEKRISGGSVDQLVITGSEYTLLVKKQSNIRAILGSSAYEYNHQNGSGVHLSDTFASSFFCLVPVYGEEGELTGYTFYGGGRGHGVGMSQNAVDAMSKCGYRYDAILQFFYPGVQIETIY